jgi:hypothetical protein
MGDRKLHPLDDRSLRIEELEAMGAHRKARERQDSSVHRDPQHARLRIGRPLSESEWRHEEGRDRALLDSPRNLDGGSLDQGRKLQLFLFTGPLPLATGFS